MKTIWFACVLSVLVCGCATPPQSHVSLTCNSNPEYATIYRLDGTCVGMCPVVQWYSVSAEDRAKGTLNGQGLKARWVSGAEMEYPTFTLPVNGTDRQITFTRPSNAPYPELDAGFALQKEANAVAGRQAATAEKQADAADRSVGNPALRALYYGAARSAAAEGDMQKANAFRTLGDMQ